AGGLLQINGGGFVNTKSYAAFGQASYEITERLGLTLGGRYTIDDKSFEGTEEDINFFYSKIGFTSDMFPDPNDLARLYPVGIFEDTFNSFDIRVGLDYKINKDVLVYASYSTGFKSGGWTTRLTAPLLEAPRFDPEEAKTYEIGLKSEIANKLRFNAAAFFTDYTNLQIVVQRAVSPFLENAAEAEIKGLEFDLKYVANKRLSLTGGLGLLEGKYTRIDEGAAITTDNKLVNAPSLSGSMALDFTTPFSSGAKVVLHGDYFFKSTVYNNAENTPSLVQDPIGVLNLSATYTSPDSKWNFSIGARNATNVSYITSGFFQPGVGYTLGTHNRPRYLYTTLGFSL
ncbi:MAG: TonB-dependent receptor, partial [Bacteroidota bacterium]